MIGCRQTMAKLAPGAPKIRRCSGDPHPPILQGWGPKIGRPRTSMGQTLRAGEISDFKISDGDGQFVVGIKRGRGVLR